MKPLIDMAYLNEFNLSDKINLLTASVVYLAIGILFLLGVAVEKFLHRRKASNWMELAEEIRLSHMTNKQKIIEKFILPAIVIMLLLFAWPVAIVLVILQRKKSETEQDISMKWEPEIFTVKREHLIEPLTLIDIEYREIIDDQMGGAPRKPFVHFNRQWEQFKTLIKPGDVLWSFKAKWGNHDRTAELKEGYALLEDEIIKSFFVKRIAPFQYVKERRSIKKMSLAQRLKEASPAR